MAIGVTRFQGERLAQAREARSLTAVALADLVGISAASITQYEKNAQKPRPEVLDSLANKLNLPTKFFLKPISKRRDPKIFYRSMSSATKAARTRAEQRYEWFREIVEYLSAYFDFPLVNLPVLDVPKDFKELTNLHIESLAEQTRAYWNLGSGPIMNVVRTLETNGVLVARGYLGAETLEAFSELDVDEQPYVFLASDSVNLVRSRFSAAHELAHLILHKNVEKKSIRKAAEFRLIEEQAHHFAAAFLLPANSFENELTGFSLDSFRALKGRWKISIAAMIKRCEQLNLLSAEQLKRLWINRNRRGWRVQEPLDDLPEEEPQLIPKSFNLLVENRIKTKEQILDDLMLSASDIEELAFLGRGYFNDNLRDEPNPELKIKNLKVVQFRRT